MYQMEDEIYDETNYIYDEYQHVDSKLFYSVTKIVSDSDYFKCGCVCKGSECTKENDCSCLKYGDNYRLVENGSVALRDDKFQNVPIFECNFNCTCFGNLINFKGKNREEINRLPVRCLNRNVQFGPLEHLEIFRAGKKGLGLKTKKEISRGSFICEYAGEVISLEEAKKRQKNHGKNGMNYIFILREYAGDYLNCVTCVDPSLMGNIGRYINHSCNPNSVIVPVRVNDSIPWLCVFAVRDIKANEEICYDYSGYDPAGESNEGYKIKRKSCLCGDAACKKYLPFQSII